MKKEEGVVGVVGVVGGGDDGDKSDQDLVVDDGNESGAGGAKENGKENGKDAGESGSKKDPLSPSSQRSTPASGASGNKSTASGKEDKPVVSPASAAKMSPPVSKALAGLGEYLYIRP